MNKLILVLVTVSLSLSFINKSIAQVTPPVGCSGTVSNGQNLITNGDFSTGYNGWTHGSQYTQYTPCSGCYSVPGNIYVGTTPTDFNHAFTNFPAHDAASANFLMVDGICQVGVDLWSQSNIPIAPNTNYYFTVWITALDNFTPHGTLRFNINGTPLPDTIAAPDVAGNWIQYTAVWYSGVNPPATTTISIQNTTTTGCTSAVDFAIDDISFIPGCDYGLPGPLPNLGPDFSICGKSLPVSINPGLSPATAASPNIIYTWYQNGVAVSSGSGPSFYNFSVNSPGTYSVCVDSAGSCPRTDIINITHTYSISLGPDQVLCNPTSTATLDPGYSGIGATYTWYNNGTVISGATSESYVATVPGTYSVSVSDPDPSCGVKADTAVVTSYTVNLGPNQVLCNPPATATLSPGYSAKGVTYQWYDNGSAISGATNENYTVSSAGTYSVSVNDSSCGTKSQSIVVTSYSVNLGSDVTLCRPATATFNPGYAATGVTYQWYDNGTVISGATQQSYTANTPGTYSVKVHDPTCGNKTASVNVTTNAAVANNGTFCPTTNGGTGIAQLSVTGSGKYKWWSAATGGTALAAGSTYTTPVLSGPGPYTYYVEDTSTFIASVGPTYSSSAFPFSGSVNAGSSQSNLYFNALTSMVIDTITVYPYNYYCGPGTMNTINFIVTDSIGNTVGTSNYSAPCTGTGQPASPMKVPVGISVPKGNKYKLALNSGSNAVAFSGNPSSFQYPVTYNSAVVFLKNDTTTFNKYYEPNAFPGYFNWVITHGVYCDRVQVIASESCPACTSAKAADSATVDFKKFCAGTVSNITLSVHGGSGDTLVWYSDSCGGTRIASNHTGADVSVPAPSKTTTYYARWESSQNKCYATCASITVTPVTAPTPAVTFNPDTNYVCNDKSVTVKGNVPTVGTGLWTVVSGAGTINNPDSAALQVTGLKEGYLTLKWTISNSPCPDTSSEVTIHMDTLSTPVISGLIAPCNSTTGLTYVASPYNSNINYVWSVGTANTLTITAGGNTDTVTVNVGTAIDTLKVTAVYGACTLKAPLVISPVVPPTPAVAGKDSSICNGTSYTLQGNTPTIGKGVWSLISGTGVVASPNSPNSQVTGIGAGDLTLKWTISNSPCPDTSNNVTIHADTLTSPVITGATFKPCDATVGLSYMASPYDSQVAYKWTIGSANTLTITSADNKDTVTINVGSSVDTLKVSTILNSCNLDTFQVISPVPPPSPAVAGKDSSICNATNYTLQGNTPTYGKGVWTVVSGIGTITNDSNATSSVTGIGVGDLTLKWTISNSPCPDTSSEVTIHRDTLTAPVIIGSTVKPCDSTAGLSYMVSSYDSKVAYKWTIGSANTLIIASADNKDTVTINVGSSVDTLKVSTILNSCNLDTFQVISPVPPPSPAVAGKDSSICNATNYTLQGNTPTYGKGVWTVVSGIGTITDDSSATSSITGIGLDTLVLKWTISNSPCPDTSSQVKIHRDTLSYPFITGTILQPCSSATNLTYYIGNYNDSSSYQWSMIGAGSKVVSNNKDSVTVSVGNSNDTLLLVETNHLVPACTLTVDSVLTLAPDITPPQLVSFSGTTCVDTFNLQALIPTVGVGVWSVSTGNGVIAKDSNVTTVAGLSVGVNIFKWTVTGCGGPLSDSIVVDVLASNLKMQVTSPSDTQCFGVKREISVAVTPSQEHYKYVWDNATAKTIDTTSQPNFYVTPETDSIVYYVYAYDSLSCLSNIDTIVVHSTPKQNLFFPNVITPDNGDALNQVFKIAEQGGHGTSLLPGATLEVYNRWGDRVFEAKNYPYTSGGNKQWWDAKGIDDGVYYYYLKTGCGDDAHKGWLEIVR